MTCTSSFAGRTAALFAAAFAVLALASPASAPAAGTDLAKLLAPASVCPYQAQLQAEAPVQERAMRCMTNYARKHAGLAPLTPSKALVASADHKAADIVRCDEFSHEACGREFTYWMLHFGYLQSDCWEAAENIAWGTGRIGTVRAIFNAWLHSPGHRENILGNYTEIGIGLRVGTLEGHRGAHVWAQEFGSHQC